MHIDVYGPFLIPVDVGTRTMLGTCPNACVFKLLSDKIFVKAFTDNKLTKLGNAIALSGRLRHLYSEGAS